MFRTIKFLKIGVGFSPNNDTKWTDDLTAEANL